MKFPSLSTTLRLLKPFAKSQAAAKEELERQAELTSYDKIEEIVSIAHFQSDRLAILMKYQQLTEVQQQLTIVSLVEHDMVEALEMILFSGNDVNFMIRGQTPLHFAIKHQNKNIVRVLIKHGADLEQKDIYKETALNSAVRTGNVDIVEYLLEQGAEANTHSSDNTTPLELAIHNRDGASVNLLKKYGAQLSSSYLIKTV